MLTYNCSPSFNRRKDLDDPTIAASLDPVAQVITAGQASTLALNESTEAAQF